MFGGVSRIIDEHGMAIQIGDIIGDYQVKGILGRGGMGMVFRVRSLLTDREEAMKVFLNEDSSLADRFLHEIKVHASLVHPNIATLHAAMRMEDRVVMIMELVEGVTLEDTLRNGPVEIPLAVRYIDQTLAALAFAHERNVIHRDIKPANILIGADGIIKLTDFGVARSTMAPAFTGVGFAVGTLAYMSPEQILSTKADARSDLYSLGLTCYEMVTGIRPVRGENEHALMNAQVSVVPPPPFRVNPRVPQTLSAAIMREIDKDPARRFQSAQEFCAALTDPIQSSQASVATSPELAELESRLSRVIGPFAKLLVADAARRCDRG
jgi:serine/threonine-protein kinase